MYDQSALGMSESKIGTQFGQGIVPSLGIATPLFFPTDMSMIENQ
jgi:hypothetical protein